MKKLSRLNPEIGSSAVLVSDGRWVNFMELGRLVGIFAARDIAMSMEGSLKNSKSWSVISENQKVDNLKDYFKPSADSLLKKLSQFELKFDEIAKNAVFLSRLSEMSVGFLVLDDGGDKVKTVEFLGGKLLGKAMDHIASSSKSLQTENPNIGSRVARRAATSPSM